MEVVPHVESVSTLPPGVTLPLSAAPQQQPNLQLLLLQILTQLQNLELGQNHCKKNQQELNHITEKYNKAQQRWKELEEDLTKEINSLRQKQSNFPNLQEDLRQCREELKQARSTIINLQQEKDIVTLQLEKERSALQNERWNKTLSLAERFVYTVEEKGKCLVLVSDNLTTDSSTESWQAKVTALQKQVEEKQSKIQELESGKMKTKQQYPVIGKESLSRVVRYCEKCNIIHTLFAAVKANNADVTLALLTNGVDANSVDGSGRTPLIWAAEKGDVEVGEVLLKNGANTEARVLGDHSKAALHYCAQHGHLEFCRLLLDNGADIDSLEDYKQNAIFWSGWFDHLDVTKFLVERGSNIKIRNTANRNVEENSRANGKVNVANWLATQR
ncbi:histone-lysine N-methyltransferase EHMT1-like [Periplaneta americana]|uniref:histone-lysine N-methyltransferase EHMT1-like n=1 Tax=Periplaneta americana TaxID=6978 RepID=UPI0037E85582